MRALEQEADDISDYCSRCAHSCWMGEPNKRGINFGFKRRDSYLRSRVCFLVATLRFLRGPNGDSVMEARPVKIGAVSCTIRALTITVAVLLAIVTTALLLSDPEYGVMPQLLMAVMIGVVTTVQGWILSRLPSVS